MIYGILISIHYFYGIFCDNLNLGMDSEDKMMGKIMPLEQLSGIMGAAPSDAVEELFRVIRAAVPDGAEENPTGGTNPEAVSLEELRSDEIVLCPESQRELIRKNFPREKNGFLVVPKVIEEQE